MIAILWSTVASFASEPTDPSEAPIPQDGVRGPTIPQDGVRGPGIPPSGPSVRFLGDGALVIAVDGGGGVVSSCTSPCALALSDAPLTVSAGGSKGLTLDSGAEGRAYRLDPGHPGRRSAGLLTALLGTTAFLITTAVDGSADVGAAPYLAGAALSGTGLALTIGTRPRLIEEGP